MYWEYQAECLKFLAGEKGNTMTKTRLITENDLELKVGDTFRQRLGNGYSYDYVVGKIEIIPNTGVKVFSARGNGFWYQDIVKVTREEKTVVTHHLVYTPLDAPILEVPLPARGVFKPGDKVFYYFEEGYNGGREAGPQWEVVAISEREKVWFDGGGFCEVDKVFHEWELEEESQDGCCSAESPLPPTKNFTPGERVWWKTSATVLTPVGRINYENIRALLTNNRGEEVGYCFEGNVGWQPTEKIHHMWEKIDETS